MSNHFRRIQAYDLVTTNKTWHKIRTLARGKQSGELYIYLYSRTCHRVRTRPTTGGRGKLEQRDHRIGVNAGALSYLHPLALALVPCYHGLHDVLQVEHLRDTARTDRRAHEFEEAWLVRLIGDKRFQVHDAKFLRRERSSFGVTISIHVHKRSMGCSQHAPTPWERGKIEARCPCSTCVTPISGVTAHVLLPPQWASVNPPDKKFGVLINNLRRHPYFSDLCPLPPLRLINHQAEQNQRICRWRKAAKLYDREYLVITHHSMASFGSCALVDLRDPSNRMGNTELCPLPNKAMATVVPSVAK